MVSRLLRALLPEAVATTLRNLTMAGTPHSASFSQSGEDLIVRLLFDSHGIHRPTYLDIGANHPFKLNNTAVSYFRGSSGVAIEPNPRQAAVFRRKRPRDRVLQAAIGVEATDITLFVMSASEHSTTVAEDAHRMHAEGNLKIVEEVRVPVVTYDQVLRAEFGNHAPDFVSLDCEGIDVDVLRSIDLETRGPKVLCVETVAYSAGGWGHKRGDIPELMFGNGYRLFADTYINSIFVRTDWFRTSP